MHRNTLGRLMKDRKSLYLLIFALIVVSIAFTLISVWGYRFYFSKKAPQSLIDPSKPKVLAVNKINDAKMHQLLFDSALQQLNNPGDTITYDSSDHELAFKIREFNRIKNEIGIILKNRISVTDATSETKIAALEKKLDELRNQNLEITKENARLNEKINQLLENKQEENEEKQASGKKKQQPASSLPLLVSHLRFAAYHNETKTRLASEINKLAGSFEINVKPENTSEKIFVVIVQPDGKILQKAGSIQRFETASGKKAYSAVLTFDNGKDNHKRLQFSINSDHFQKGKYLMQVYHEGIMIGRLENTLY